MQLFISPVDVWLFRNGRPFTAGSDHRAVTLFPPYPSVIQGVIRSHQLILEKVDLNDRKAISEAVGTGEDYKNLRLRGPILAKWENEKLTRYFPVPADLVAQEKQFVPLKLHKPDQERLITSALTQYLLYSPTEPTKQLPGQWLTEEDLRKALSNQPVGAVKAGELFERESRFGIGRDDQTRTTREHALYEVEMIRAHPNVGLYVEVEGYDGWPSRGLLRMGGEGRGASYILLNAAPLLPLKQSFPDGKLPPRFKVYFVTPTYFRRGWLPETWERFFEGEVRLVAAVLNRYESLGGYDWAKNEHKPARRYVPAGSVYYFESPGTVNLTQCVLETNAIADEGAQIGFGQIFIQEV